jgi:hypothetical protein
VTAQYPIFWTDQGYTVRIPKNDYLTIPFKNGWDSGKIAAKMYPANKKNKIKINKIFNKLYK